MRTLRGEAIVAEPPGRGAGGAVSALAQAGFSLVGRASDGASALRLIRSRQCDLVLADAVLPGMDGVALAERIRALKLNVQPAILLLRVNGCRLPGEDRLGSLGAAALNKPPSGEVLAAALDRLAERGPALPPEISVRLTALMDALGIPGHPGRECLRRAVALVWADRRRLSPLKTRLYPEVARLTGMSPAQAERAIRYVIDAAWRTGDIDRQQQIFGDTIDARRGKPTCGEMIAQLAEELRWEGRL